MKYFYNILLGVLSMELGQLWNWFPEPETTFKAGCLAICTGFLAAFGRWCFHRVHKLFTNTKPRL
ncbi:hypothetical protein [Rufibacter quisquiliarum]|uniref:Uncharacterized protein n=1 Tax=Rufibacter quisquiliarum TaxID=1549639 RepID=A0A839GM65_9BACT|nr:hypothetical protein [Rufibacter quisquiliarum]MBA9076066.1 hypothetical protein [Rufibacter quisquiliarum]